MMSRRLLVILSLMSLLLALVYAAVQLMLIGLPSMSAQWGAVADRPPALRTLAVADDFQAERRRVSRELGQQPPAVEIRDQR